MDVAVLGADRGGATLAGRCVRGGHLVRLYGRDANAVMDAVDGIERDVGPEATPALDGTTDLESAVRDAEVVLDTMGRNGDSEIAGVDTTRERLADVEDTVAEGALIATGDPTVSVTSVLAGLRRPGRALGLHFPDPEGPIVEVVLAEQTTAEARERALAFAEGLDCTPIVVDDAPGFVITRLDLALIAEAIRLLEDGVASVAHVDRAMAVGRDHPTGPLERADVIGLDSVLAALDDLAERLEDRFAPPGLLREKVADGDLGTQTGRGFYRWEGGEPAEATEPDPTVHARDERPGPNEP